MEAGDAKGQNGLVLITGGAGRIGRYLRSGLPAFGWSLRSMDKQEGQGDDFVQGDILDPEVLAAAMAGAAAVVHLAAVVTSQSAFGEILGANIDGTYRVFDAAREAGVRRIVFASSNHANGFAPISSGWGPGVRDRPDSFYGVSKIFGEALAQMYADRYGIDVVSIRIGSCFERPSNPRMLGSWLSPGDAVRLVHACLTSKSKGHVIVYGASANTRGWWDLAPARALGYRPEDDAETYRDEVLAASPGEEPPGPDDAQGGSAAWTAFGDVES
jgi:uronate dehydrogenase